MWGMFVHGYTHVVRWKKFVACVDCFVHYILMVVHRGSGARGVDFVYVVVFVMLCG